MSDRTSVSQADSKLQALTLDAIKADKLASAAKEKARSAKAKLKLAKKQFKAARDAFKDAKKLARKSNKEAKRTHKALRTRLDRIAKHKKKQAPVSKSRPKAKLRSTDEKPDAISPAAQNSQ